MMVLEMCNIVIDNKILLMDDIVFICWQGDENNVDEIGYS